VTLNDITDVLGPDDAVIEEEQAEPYLLPAGCFPITEPPPASQLVGFARNVSAPDVVGKQLFFNYDGYGWLHGKVLRRNGDQRRSMDNGTIANFIVAYDMDEGSSTAMLLEAEDYSALLLAPVGSWFLLSEEEAAEAAEVGEAAAGEATAAAGEAVAGEAAAAAGEAVVGEAVVGEATAAAGEDMAAEVAAGEVAAGEVAAVTDI